MWNAFHGAQPWRCVSSSRGEARAGLLGHVAALIAARRPTLSWAGVALRDGLAVEPEANRVSMVIRLPVGAGKEHTLGLAAFRWVPWKQAMCPAHGVERFQVRAGRVTLPSAASNWLGVAV